MALYVHGVLKAQSRAVTTTLGAIHNMFSDIGRTFYSSDSCFDFNLNEFRISKGAFVQHDVDATQALGPDQLVAPPLGSTNRSGNPCAASFMIKNQRVA
jgi:hypothetical protein